MWGRTLQWPCEDPPPAALPSRASTPPSDLENRSNGLHVGDDVVRSVYEEARRDAVKCPSILGPLVHLQKVAGDHAQGPTRCAIERGGRFQ